MPTMPTNTESPYDLLTPVFAELGRAVYSCQCFEWNLRHLLSLIAHDMAEGERGAYDAAWEFQNNQALGQFIKALKRRIEVPSDLEEYLKQGVDIRNRLVHRYITDNARRLYDPKGRLALEVEVSDMKEEINARDDIVRQLLDAFHVKYGTSRSEFERQADALWQLQNPGPDSGQH